MKGSNIEPEREGHFKTKSYFKNLFNKLFYFILYFNSKYGLLVLIEIIAISMYFVIPFIASKLQNNDAFVLLGNNPIYLNKEKTIGTYENIHQNNDDSIIYNYSISACFYINPQYSIKQDKKGTFINIINYGNKPLVQYDFKNNSLFIKSINSNSNENIILKKYKLPLQKWNNLVIQYNNGIIDIFMNGDLIISKKNQIPYMKYDKVVVGENNGLQGGIKNVKYYSRNLTLGEIKLKSMYCN